MIDNDINIIVPYYNVIVPASRWRPSYVDPIILYNSVKEWLEINAHYYRCKKYTGAGLSQLNFNLFNTTNKIRIEFANKYDGYIEPNDFSLVEKCSNNNYIIYLPLANIHNGNYQLTNRVFAWLNDNVGDSNLSISCEKRKWIWSGLATINDIKHAKFLFKNVNEDEVILFKLTFG